MAQQKQLAWTDLRVGLFVFFGLILTAVAIFYVTGGTFLGPKYRLVTYMPEVNGLQSGAPVELDGLHVGNVQQVSLTPRPQDAAHSVTVVLELQSKFQDQIRTDSVASLVTQGLLGDRYVAISRGLTGSVVPNNGTIPAKLRGGTAEIMDRSTELLDNLNALSTQVQSFVSQIQNSKGTVGKLINDPALYDHLNGTASHLDAVTASIQQGQGSLGKLVASDDLYNKADDVIGAIHDQKGTLGKLVYDPALYTHVTGIAQNGDALLADVRAGKGTLGKLTNDDSLFNNVRDASANLRDATAKLNSNQGTAGKLFSDPALYDNLTGATGDLRLMINDFRTNPKKFLHIKLGIF